MLCRQLLTEAYKELQQHRDEVDRLKLERCSMRQLAMALGPWHFCANRLDVETYQENCIVELEKLNAHHRANGRAYEDQDLCSDAVKATIRFRVDLLHWADEMSRAHEEELREAANARAAAVAQLQYSMGVIENRRRAEVEELERDIAELNQAAATNANNLRRREEECKKEVKAAREECKKEVKALQDHLDHLERWNFHYEGLEALLDEKDAKYNTLDVRNDRQIEATQKAEKSLAASRKELAEAREELEAARGRGHAADEEAEEAREQLKGAEEEIVLLRRINHTLMEERDNARAAAINQEQLNSEWPASSPIRTTTPRPRGDVLPELEESQHSPGSWLVAPEGPMSQSPSPLRPRRQPCGGISTTGGTPFVDSGLCGSSNAFLRTSLDSTPSLIGTPV